MCQIFNTLFNTPYFRHTIKMKKLLLVMFFITSFNLPAQNQDELILRCPMDDLGLVAIYKIDFKNNIVLSSMEGFGSSKEYPFSFRDNKIFIPPSEFGEEVINLSNYEVNTRAGYEGASWKSYKCSKT